MEWDRGDAASRAKDRDRALSTYVRHELAAFSSFYRGHFGEAHLDLRGVKGLAGLTPVPPTAWQQVEADPAAFILRPEEADLARHGNRQLVLRVTWAKIRRRTDRVNREVIDPIFKPVHWHLVDGVPVGYTSADLGLLGLAGSRLLSLAGLTRYDVMVGLVEPGPSLAYWQLVLGARRGDVSALHLGPAPDLDTLLRAEPSVLAGGPDALAAVLAGCADAGASLPHLHTVLVVGDDPDPRARDRLEVAAEEVSGDGVMLVAAWAPRGTRALWAECRRGAGFHTYPDLEVLEVEDDGGRVSSQGEGELLWSSLGWRGTAFFRLRTGTRVELREQRCAACGRVGPVVVTERQAAVPVPLGVLSTTRGVAAWQVELRRVDGTEELFVFLSLADDAQLTPVLKTLEARLRATQYVVLPEEDVRARVAAAGSRILDLRP